MKTSAQRIARYNARMQSSLIDPTLSAVAAEQLSNFTSYVNDFVPKQEQLRVLLVATAIPIICWAGYEAYHAELYKKSKQYSGTFLIAYATVLHDKYVTVGGGALATATLKLIANDIYGVVIP
jgi:hypothetical protein